MRCTCRTRPSGSTTSSARRSPAPPRSWRRWAGRLRRVESHHAQPPHRGWTDPDLCRRLHGGSHPAPCSRFTAPDSWRSDWARSQRGRIPLSHSRTRTPGRRSSTARSSPIGGSADNQPVHGQIRRHTAGPRGEDLPAHPPSRHPYLGQPSRRQQIQRGSGHDDAALHGPLHHPRGDVDVDTQPVEPIRCGRPVWMPTRIRGVAVDRHVIDGGSGGQRRGDGDVRIGKPPPSGRPHPFDDVAAAVQHGRLDGGGDPAQQFERRVVTGTQRPTKSDQIGETMVASVSAVVPRSVRSAPARPQAGETDLAGTASRSGSSRSAARAAARGPLTPGRQGSPNSGRPAGKRRARG